MNEKEDSVDKLLHLINNNISLIVGVPTAPALDGMSAPDYKFLKLFLLLILIENQDKVIKFSYCYQLLKVYKFSHQSDI
jgi:hypothetical protein